MKKNKINKIKIKIKIKLNKMIKNKILINKTNCMINLNKFF